MGSLLLLGIGDCGRAPPSLGSLPGGCVDFMAQDRQSCDARQTCSRTGRSGPQFLRGGGRCRAGAAGGLPPDGPEAEAAVALLVQAYAEPLGREDSPAFRAWLLEQFAAHTDPRAGRYWELVGRIRGPDHQDRTAADGFTWLTAA